MPKKLRVLYVLPNVPSRIRVRPYHLIGELARCHDITALCLVPSASEESAVEALRHYCKVETVTLSPRAARVRCARASLSGTPLWVSYFDEPAMRTRLASYLASGAVDLVHLEHIKTAPWIAGQRRSGIPIVFDAVDCASLYLERRVQTLPNTRPLHRAFWASELRRMRRYETAAMAACDVTLVNSPIDRDYLATVARPGTQIRVLLNGTDHSYFHPWCGPREPRRLVFCAKLDYYPNAQAALFLANEVMPRVWESEPRLQLTIVGSNPRPSIMHLAQRDPRITVTGYVPDVRPYVGGAEIALCPLLVKAGIQNKVLEALALGTPVVATALAAEGLDVKPGEHLLVATGAPELAAQIVRLHRDAALRAALAEAGHRFVAQNHDWRRVAATLDGIYQELCIS